MRWTDETRIETPEQIEVELELAGLGSRFLAQAIDWLLKGLVTLVLLFITFIIIGLLGLGGPKGADGLLQDPPSLVVALTVALIYLLWMGYSIYFEVRWNGQTPGKSATGIRVIQAGGAPVDFRAAGIRNLLAAADFLPSLYFLGALLILVTDRKQRLGDLAAGTIVVRERTESLGADLEEEVDEFASDQYRFTRAQLANLTRADRTLIREFLRRCMGMDRRSWQRLAMKMADTFLQKTEYPLSPEALDGFEARVFLASLLRDLDEKLRHD